MLEQLTKLPVLFGIGGTIYYLIEIVSRGYSHWTMFALGGVCFVLIGLMDQNQSVRTPFLLQMAASALLITALEFATGVVVNLVFHLNIWDYSHEAYNIMGQICLRFTVIWFFLSAPAIVLDDLLRLWFWGDPMPKTLEPLVKLVEFTGQI